MRVGTASLLWGGVVGAVGFVVAFLVEGFVRSGYDPVRLQISYLSLGVGGWVQVASFLIAGVLVLSPGGNEDLAFRSFADDASRILFGLDALVGRLPDEAVGRPAGELGADDELRAQPSSVAGSGPWRRRGER
jgi:hypothetical protein